MPDLIKIGSWVLYVEHCTYNIQQTTNILHSKNHFCNFGDLETDIFAIKLDVNFVTPRHINFLYSTYKSEKVKKCNIFSYF